jgi:hypothetical protein
MGPVPDGRVAPAVPDAAVAGAPDRFGLIPRAAGPGPAPAAGAMLRGFAGARRIALCAPRTHPQRIFDRTGTRSRNARIALFSPKSRPPPEVWAPAAQGPGPATILSGPRRAAALPRAGGRARSLAGTGRRGR